MSSWLVWTVTAVLAFILAWVGYQFSIRTLRWVACAVAAATAIFIAWYGLIYPAQRPGSLTSAFARGADTLSSALLGHRVPAPGRVGWVVIVVLLVNRQCDDVVRNTRVSSPPCSTNGLPP